MNFFEKFANKLKDIFTKNIKVLPEPKANEENTYACEKESEESISEKNIIMFFYKQLRLGNLEAKYIPIEYREKILALLKEEKNIRLKNIEKLKNSGSIK